MAPKSLFGSCAKQTERVMINTSIKNSRREKRLRIYNATEETSEHLLDYSQTIDTNGDQEVKDQKDKDCLKVIHNIQFGNLDAYRTSEMSETSAIDRDGVRNISARSKN